ncbi:hypothetical protein MHYP_G00308960 [Metynnis hypsauchen]
MNTVIVGLVYKCCAVYLDDVVIVSPTFEQHLLDLGQVFSRLESAGLSLKLGKYQFYLDELKFLGYTRYLTPRGILPDMDKVRAVTEFPVPTDVRQVRQFLGLTSYYRRFIGGYAQQAEPLFSLTRQDFLFLWDENCQRAMDFLKECLTSAPIVCFPDFERAFCLHTEACDMGLGAALMQQDKTGKEVVVAYASHTLHKSEKPYSTTEKECLAVIWALEHFRPYIEGLPVTVYTDHSSLRWLMSWPNPTGRLVRWCLRLQDFDIRIIHKPGARNQVPDALSRNPVQSDQGPTDLLPEHAVIAGLDLRAQPPVELTDKEQLQHLQRDDPALAAVLKKLESSQCTESEEDSESKFVVNEGLLHYKDSSVSCSLHPLKELKFYAPESIRGSLLNYFHDHPTAGHLVCQFTKPCQKKPAGLLVPVQASEPWEVAGVDFVGPLPRTAAGNVYILVFIDCFSKWIEVSAVREATAQVAASKFQSEVFARHGAPKHLISDRGAPFMRANLTAKFACVYTGPYWVTQKLSEVNYRLANMDGTDVGVVHVVNLQPFYTWTTAEAQNSRQHRAGCSRQDESHRTVIGSPVVALETREDERSTEKKGYAPDGAGKKESASLGERSSPESSMVDLSQTLAEMFDGDTDMPRAPNYDLRDRADTITMPLTDTADMTGQDPDIGVTVSPTHVTCPTDCPLTHTYSLRPRVHPRVTTDWGTNRWTNWFHTQRLDQDGRH